VARSGQRLDWLDLIRGGAALLVLAGHLRAYIFQSFSQLSEAGIHVSMIDKVFYFVTSLGNEAVMIFFALSGFLVGGKALGDLLNGTFSWVRYGTRRLTRLWIVIIPSIILTLCFDALGFHLTGGHGYNGEYLQLYASGPLGPYAEAHNVKVIAGNILFLQTISVPTFGTNGPMWSLANEFWYYVGIPLAGWLVVARGAPLCKMLAAVVLAALFLKLPSQMVQLGAIWVAGAVAAWATGQSWAGSVLRNGALRLTAIAGFFGALVAAKLGLMPLGNLGLGLAIAAALPVIANLPRVGKIGEIAARSLSEISYTLYLTHFPLISFLALVWFAPRRWVPSFEAVAVYAGILCLALCWATLIWWLFERNTDKLWRSVMSRISMRIQKA
jgi:peptidoglycan/LPS O-acetylase OafA/YrhL